MKTKGCGKYKAGMIFGDRVVRAVRFENNLGKLEMECLECHAVALVRPKLAARKCRACVTNWGREVTLGFIYGIVDPVSGEIVYLGATTKNPIRRLMAHWNTQDEIRKSDQPFYIWLRSLRDSGGFPGLIIVEEVAGNSLSERETFWIRKLKNETNSLLNIEGNGGLALSH